MRGSLEARFKAKVSFAASDECWLWIGAISRSHRGGYKHGTILDSDTGKTLKASRVAFRLYKGEIPEGMNVLHSCDNGLCVNPAHLFLGTHADNMADMKAKRRSTFGERSAKTKLTADAVLEILTSSEPNGVMSERFAVDASSISNIRRRKHWQHIEVPPVKYRHMGRVQSPETRAKISASRYRLFRERAALKESMP